MSLSPDKVSEVEHGHGLPRFTQAHLDGIGSIEQGGLLLFLRSVLLGDQLSYVPTVLRGSARGPQFPSLQQRSGSGNPCRWLSSLASVSPALICLR